MGAPVSSTSISGQHLFKKIKIFGGQCEEPRSKLAKRPLKSRRAIFEQQNFKMEETIRKATGRRWASLDLKWQKTEFGKSFFKKEFAPVPHYSSLEAIHCCSLLTVFESTICCLVVTPAFRSLIPHCGSWGKNEAWASGVTPPVKYWFSSEG